MGVGKEEEKEERVYSGLEPSGGWPSGWETLKGT